MKDFYKTLGVSENASKSEIGVAYKKLAREYHPDRVKDGDRQKAEAAFKEINEAYTVLSNEESRQRYDMERRGSQNFQGGGFGGFQGGFNQNSFNFFNFNDFFSGEGDGLDRSKGEDIHISIRITLENSFQGYTETFSLNKKSPCRNCLCSSCGGVGKKESVAFNLWRVQQSCDKCKGTGSSNSNCSACRGKSYTIEQKNISINIPSGVKNNDVIKYQKMGNDGIQQPGDLFLSIKINPHKVFEVEEINLKAKLSVSVWDLLLGTQIKLQGIDGKDLFVTIPECSSIDQPVILKEQGMTAFNAKSKKRGDLFVYLKLQLPTFLTREQRETVRKLKASV